MTNIYNLILFLDKYPLVCFLGSIFIVYPVVSFVFDGWKFSKYHKVKLWQIFIFLLLLFSIIIILYYLYFNFYFIKHSDGAVSLSFKFLSDSNYYLFKNTIELNNDPKELADSLINVLNIFSNSFFFAISVNIFMTSMYSGPLKVIILIGLGTISTILYNYVDYAIKIFTI